MTGVFISHVAADTEIATRLAARLQTNGVRVFLLEWLEPGLVTVLEQEHALAEATHGILLISRATMTDPAVREEYAALVQHARAAAGRRLIPVLVGEITDAELPRFAAIRKQVDLRDAGGSGGHDARIAELLRVLRPRADGVPADAAGAPPTAGAAEAAAGARAGVASGSGPVADIRPARIPHHSASGNGTESGVPDGNSIMHRTGAAQPAPVSAPEPASGTDDRIRILLLAANPRSTARLAIDEEAREIAEKLRLSRDRDTFDLITCWAVRPADLLQHLNRHSPQIVHFSGHGQRDGEIVLAAGDGTDRRVDAAALAELFRVMKDEIRVVVLNACYSAAQAQAIGQHIDYIVGMRAPIADEAATVLAAAFYSALGFRRTVPQAFEQATAALMLHGIAGHDIPELLVRPGADPRLRIGR